MEVMGLSFIRMPCQEQAPGVNKGMLLVERPSIMVAKREQKDHE